MKKHISILFAALLLTSCAKEIANGNADAPVFRAVMESGTKVHLDGELNGRWDKDDMVTIFLGTIANQQYKFNGATGDENGTFTMVGTPSFATSGLAANYAVYPYNSSTSISDAGVISCTFPEAQNYAPGSYGIGANTMVAVTESTSDLLLMFKNACGYLRVSLYGDASITSISLQGNNGEKIAGAGTITAACDAAPVVAMDSTATGLITLDCGTGVALGTTKETATTFYFVIPPVEFANGLTIRATDTEGNVFEKTTSKAITIARNTILKMTALEYQGVPAADTPNGELSFYAEEASTIALNKVGSPDDITLEYLVKGAKWVSYTIGETISLAAGDSVCFRAGEGGNETFSKDYGVGYQFSMTGMIRASGNIMSLLDTQMELTSVPMYSFNGLFSGCSSLTTAPELPATSMYTACYSGMFKGCTGLSIAPKLPATILKDYCYHEMFRGCTGLTNAPDLPATNLADYCYAGMFRFCSGLTSAPELPSTSLAQNCYSSMFRSCTGLPSAPELPAITLVDGCYTSMFVGCSGLSYVKMLATDVSATSCMANWLNGVASTGTFVKNSAATWDITGPSGVPEGWTVETYPATPHGELSFYAEEASTIALNKVGSPNGITLEYLVRGADWTSYTIGEAITLAVGDSVCFRAGEGGNATFSKDFSNYYNFSMTGKIRTSGNIMSLLDQSMKSESVPYYAFGNLFEGCAALTSAPKLPAVALASYCYRSMFRNCTTLANAPELPATTLAFGCYEYMFDGCTGLTSAPDLPATTLKSECYWCMFMRCSNLVAAPELPATTLADGCYGHMFAYSGITSAPALPATTLANICYCNMFEGCSSLTTASDLPATTLTERCYAAMFNLCRNLTSAPKLPATTLATGCYSSMFDGCSSLTAAPELPATTLTEKCYYNMFELCTKLTAAPNLPASTLAKDCYGRMFAFCTGLTSAPELLASTLSEGCYSNMYYRCSKLNYVKMLATNVSASDCMTDWLKYVSSTGTFVKNSDAKWDITGPSGVPEGWTVELDYPYVDLGLSVKWAKCNLGASKPEEYGLYYQWGDVQGYGSSTSDGKYFDWKDSAGNVTYKWCNGTDRSLTKYNTYSSYGTVDNKTVLDPEDDAARVALGGNWRMPTDAEWTELRNTNNCSWTWTTVNGTRGYKVQSKKTGLTDNWIFLPAAGYRYCGTRDGAERNGNYWYTSLNTDYPNGAHYVNLSSSDISRGNGVRSSGRSIRPVCD